MTSGSPRSNSVLGHRMRERRENLGWSQEAVGVAIGLDESSARARISRYELGVHEPAVPTARLIAEALGVPLIYLYCEDDGVAMLLLGVYRLSASQRKAKLKQFIEMIDAEA